MNTRFFSRRHILRASSLTSAALMAASLIPTPVLAALTHTKETPYQQETRMLMGTIVTIAAHGNASTQLVDAMEQAFLRIERLIAIFDRHSSSSALGVLNADKRLSDAPHELRTVLDYAKKLYRDSSCAFNPGILPILDLFASQPSHQAKLAIDPKTLTETISYCDFTRLAMAKDTITLGDGLSAITLDGIAKGFIVDAAAATMRAHGINNFLINAGGDIYAAGHGTHGKPWQIAIENPVHKGQYLQSIPLCNRGIATSGGYERFFDTSKTHHHLINPETGLSATLASITVTAPTTAMADALATALAILPPEKGLQLLAQYPETACMIVGHSGERYSSASWKNKESHYFIS